MMSNKKFRPFDLVGEGSAVLFFLEKRFQTYVADWLTGHVWLGSFIIYPYIQSRCFINVFYWVFL